VPKRLVSSVLELPLSLVAEAPVPRVRMRVPRFPFADRRASAEAEHAASFGAVPVSRSRYRLRSSGCPAGAATSLSLGAGWRVERPGASRDPAPSSSL
jgi:hypothetical protein